MPDINDLLLEKRRYRLPLLVSSQEKHLLSLGTPVQKIIGYIIMAGIKIKINRFVCIPRYETEELIYLVAQELKLMLKQKKSLEVLDLATGSGFIGLALAKLFPQINFTLSDISKEAILQSQENCKINNLKNVKIVKSDLFNNIYQQFDLIVSNPPYLDIHKTDPKLFLFEPQKALVAPQEGWYFYQQIILQMKTYLKPQGLIYFEINPLLAKRFQKNKFILKYDINQKIRFAYRYY